MEYKGIIIEESLSDISILKELAITKTVTIPVTEKEETPWLDNWTMHAVVIQEAEIDIYAERLSKSIDLEHCGDWYCDFKNDEFHYVVFSNKVFKLSRSAENAYMNMKEYAISIGLPEHQLPSL